MIQAAIVGGLLLLAIIFIVQGIKQEHTLLVSGDSYSQLPLLSEGIIEKERTNTLYYLWRKILSRLL